MKVALKLAIILASLLLVANVVFAQDGQDGTCVCYAVTITADGGYIGPDLWELCIEEGPWGILCSYGAEECNDVALFGGGPDTASLNEVPLWVTGIVIGGEGGGEGGYFWTSGGGLYINGVGYTEGERFIGRGQRVNCPEPVE